jgi:hypothetical protein
MEQKTPRLKLHNFSQFGLQNQSLAFHKPIDAPDYYQPKFILFFFLSFFFLKKKKKNQSRYKNSVITRAKSYHMIIQPDIIKCSIPHMQKGQPQAELLIKDKEKRLKEKLPVACASQEAQKEHLF